jgi:dTDP-4-amino-4,6-dideoxygalactose transaminase
MSGSFEVVEAFEQRVAKFAGAKYAIATMTGTAALFLSMAYRWSNMWRDAVPDVVIPAYTFISVPMAALQLGAHVTLWDNPWTGVYILTPWNIVDGALRFKRGMYLSNTLHCLSFHARKTLNIGEGGMILTDCPYAAERLRAMRYSGRRAPHYRPEKVEMMGWQLYMTPEKAARGLHLMDYIGDGEPDQTMTYPDLRETPFFKTHPRVTIK